MKLQQLLLRNVRNLKSLDVDFRDPLTNRPLSRIVLAGANGSGKTTILESVFTLLETLGHYPDIQLKYPGFFFGGQLQLIFEARFNSTRDLILGLLFGKHPSLMTETQIAESYFLQDPNSDWRSDRIKYLELGDEPESAFAKIKDGIQAAKMREGEAIGSVLYFPSNRYLPSPQQGELGYEPKSYRWAYKYQAENEWKGSIESYLFSLNYLDLEDRDRKLPANRFQSAVASINSILTSKRISHIEKGRVVIKTEAGNTHGLNDLSSGEKQLTLLIIEILRYAVHGSVILIDEPEISLHPAWQRGLVVALEKITEQYDAQVILATHSPDIAGMVQPHEVLFLSDLEVPTGEWKAEREVLA